jgi:ATP-dependent exoDNAse (exonuclease V) alpha subunit
VTANRRDAGFRATNGEIVTVSRVDDRGRIHLKDGRELQSDFKQFAHGYAVTAHRSQGKSVDSAIISRGRDAKGVVLCGGIARQK